RGDRSISHLLETLNRETTQIFKRILFYPLSETLFFPNSSQANCTFRRLRSLLRRLRYDEYSS
ncbi:MAG: hypothetical protein ACE5H0_11310, partial [Bacteroidota bacterium]